MSKLGEIIRRIRWALPPTYEVMTRPIHPKDNLVIKEWLEENNILGKRFVKDYAESWLEESLDSILIKYVPEYTSQYKYLFKNKNDAVFFKLTWG